MTRIYKYGPDAGEIIVTSTTNLPDDGSAPTEPSETTKADLDPAAFSFVSAVPACITLAVAPYDGAAINPPAEVFALLFTSGAAIPDDPAVAIADTTIPRNSTTEAIPPEGVPAYVVPHPVVPQGAYVGKTILAYDRPE